MKRIHPDIHFRSDTTSDRSGLDAWAYGRLRTHQPSGPLLRKEEQSYHVEYPIGGVRPTPLSRAAAKPNSAARSDILPIPPTLSSI